MALGVRRSFAVERYAHGYFTIPIATLDGLAKATRDGNCTPGGFPLGKAIRAAANSVSKADEWLFSASNELS